MTETTQDHSTGHVDALGAPQAERIVGRLRSTFASGRTRSAQWRLRQLRGLVQFCEQREAEMAEALAADLGRNAHDTWFGDVASTVGEARYAIKHLKKWMRSSRTRVPLALLPGRGSYHCEPLGTVLVIGPWNYPFYLCLGPLVGAIAAGNTVVLKPSEHAPAAAALMAKYLPEYLDPEAITVVQGDGAATQALIDARVDLIFFTGGTEIGRAIMASAAKHLTPVILELGGKSPVIVSKNADLEVAARRIMWGKLLNSGQTCLAPDYVLVEASVRNELLDQLQTALTQMRSGESASQPIVNDRQYQRLVHYLDSQRDRVVVGGAADDVRIEPTLIADADPDSAVMSAEIFGPLLPLLTVRDLDDAINFVNSREKPLAAYIFSNSKEEQDRVINDVPCGAVVVNHTLMHVLAPQLPFGGVGESGMGAYHGRWGFEAFSHRKSVLKMRARPDLSMIYPPYSDRDKKLLRKLA